MGYSPWGYKELDTTEHTNLQREAEVQMWRALNVNFKTLKSTTEQ